MDGGGDGGFFSLEVLDMDPFSDKAVMVYLLTNNSHMHENTHTHTACAQAFLQDVLSLMALTSCSPDNRSSTQKHRMREKVEGFVAMAMSTISLQTDGVNPPPSSSLLVFVF